MHGEPVSIRKADMGLTSIRKLKETVRSSAGSLRHSKKIILLVIVVVASTLLLSTLISIWLSNLDDVRFPSMGTIKTSGIKAYLDTDLKNQTTEIQWGEIHPGSSQNVTLYLRSISNIRITLEMTTANWTLRNSSNSIVFGPLERTSYMNLTWNYDGSALNPGQVIQVAVTLHVGEPIDFIEFLIQKDVQQFSFDISIKTLEK